MSIDSADLQVRPHTLAFKERLIRTAALQAAFAAIDRCRRTVASGDPKGMFIVGPSGAGKSTIAASYCRQNPKQELEERTIRPVIYARLKKGSDRSIMSAVLAAAGDAAPSSGRNIDDMVYRLKRLVQACRTQLIFIDEVQYVLPEHATTRTQIAADLIKSLIDELQVSIVLVGLPESVRLLQAQRRGDVDKDQLRRRFRRTIEVTSPALESSGWKRLPSSATKRVTI